MTPVKGIQPDELETVWPRVAALIAAALKHSKRGFRLTEIKEQIAARKRQLRATWPDCAAAGITQVDAYSGTRVMTIVAFAGEDAGGLARHPAAHGNPCGRTRLQCHPPGRAPGIAAQASAGISARADRICNGNPMSSGVGPAAGVAGRQRRLREQRSRARRRQRSEGPLILIKARWSTVTTYKGITSIGY